MEDKMLVNSHKEFIYQYSTQNLPKLHIKHIISAIELLSLLNFGEELLSDRIHQAYVMCRYMMPDAKDIIAIIIGGSYYSISDNPKKTIIESFGEEWGNKYIEYFDIINEHANNELKLPTIELLKNRYNSDKMTDDETDYHIAFDYYVMENVCHHMYQDLIKVMKKNGLQHEQMVLRAYELAKKAHHGVLRKSGEPYLSHPLSVAKILADIRVDSSIVAAALLHDVAEDSDYSISDIQDECNKRVAELVDAVTSVHKEYSQSLKKSEYSQDKYTMDEASFNKLVRKVNSDPDMVYALYVKGADRIHNLSTIDIMSPQKRRDKVDETEEYYLPLFERFGLNYFADRIKDLNSRAIDPEHYLHIMKCYHSMAETSGSIKRLRDKLEEYIKEKINEYSNMYYTVGGYTASVYGRELRMDEITCAYQAAFGTSVIDPKLVDRKVIPIGILDIVIDDMKEENVLDHFVGSFVKMFVNEFSNEGYSIADYRQGSWGEFQIIIEDRHRKQYICRFSMREDFSVYRFGRTEGIFNREREAKPIDFSEKTVTVFLRDGRELKLEEGSTLIDCAFAIHPSIGLCLVAATVNGDKVSIYNRLHNGDKVNLISMTRKEKGTLVEFNPNARLYWLRRVKTTEAKKELIRYFERIYGEGDNPTFQANCNDDIIEDVAKSILPSLDRFEFD